MYVLHLGTDRSPASLEALALPSVLLLTGIASSVVVGLAVVALAQRRSRSYLLITVALGTLLARTLVGGLAMNGMVQLEIHHLAEHGLDGVMAVLLITAVYYARTTERTTDGSRA
jgi:heme/copper-type cytochrome/quinol oxidase subunit 3